ncbi:MAG: FAD-dependent oxidoreductase [Thermodesulfobacteriota bacterium]
MAKFDYDIGIIGGGAAGLTVASGSAQLGARTLLIEKEESLGGDCLHFGCVPSKTLIKSAKLYHAMKRASEFGLPAVDLPPVNFSLVAERIKSVISEIQKHDSVERFNRLGAEIRFGSPCFVDEHMVDCDGQKISAKHWVIATGSSPAPPRIPSLGEIPLITNREVFSLQELPASLIVLGGGPIAIEMAQAFCRLGSRVTVVQRSAQILSKEDRDMADTVMTTMEKEGVRFILEAEISGATLKGEDKIIRVTTPAGSQEISGDTVLLAQGRSPNVSGLGLDAIGITFSTRGIEVDNRMRTSHHHIYAPGDINGRYQFTHAAGYEGGIVVSNAVFHLPRKANFRWMPWCTFCDPELASIGLNEKRAQALGIGYSVLKEEFSANDRALAEGSTVGQLKLLLDKKEKVMGVQILGPSAGDLLAEWVAVLESKMKLTHLAGTIHPYPTLAEINKRVAGGHISSKIFSQRVRKALKLFFRLQGTSVPSDPPGE